MAISEYHQKFIEKSDEDINTRARVRIEEIRQILKALNYAIKTRSVRIMITGIQELRLLRAMRRGFEDLLASPTKFTVFDITIEHLAGEDVIEHDATVAPLPGGKHDIVYAGNLLKFVDESKRSAVLKNVYDALDDNGLGIFVLDEGDDVQIDQLMIEAQRVGISLEEIAIDVVGPGGQPLQSRAFVITT